MIVRREDWAEVLQREFSHYFRKEPFDELQAHKGFVARCRMDPEQWSGCNRVGWMAVEEETPFEVIHYEFKRLC